MPDAAMNDTPERLQAMKDAAVAVAAIPQINANIQEIRQGQERMWNKIDDILGSLHEGLVHCKGHDVQIGGLDKRVSRLEGESDVHRLRTPSGGEIPMPILAEPAPGDWKAEAIRLLGQRGSAWVLATLVLAAVLLWRPIFTLLGLVERGAP